MPPLLGFLLLDLLLSDLGLLNGCFFFGFLAGNGRASSARSATGLAGSKPSSSARGISSPINRSMPYKSTASSTVTNEIACPYAPARPVRPIR